MQTLTQPPTTLTPLVFGCDDHAGSGFGGAFYGCSSAEVGHMDVWSETETAVSHKVLIQSTSVLLDSDLKILRDPGQRAPRPLIHDLEEPGR